MTDVSQYLDAALLSCETCEFSTHTPGSALVHALTTRHTLSGETEEGHVVTVSIEEE